MSGSIFISCNANELPGFHCIRTRECECSLLLCRQLTSSDRRTDGRRTDGPSPRPPHILFRPSVDHRPLAPRTADSVRPPRRRKRRRRGGLTGVSDVGMKRTTEMHATAIMTFHFGLPYTLHTLSLSNPTPNASSAEASESWNLSNKSRET